MYRLCQLYVYPGLQPAALTGAPYSWNITPLCGSKMASHVQAAIAAEDVDGLTRDTPEVKQLWRLMRGEK